MPINLASYTAVITDKLTVDYAIGKKTLAIHRLGNFPCVNNLVLEIYFQSIAAPFWLVSKLNYPRNLLLSRAINRLLEHLLTHNTKIFQTTVVIVYSLYITIRHIMLFIFVGLQDPENLLYKSFDS